MNYKFIIFPNKKKKIRKLFTNQYCVLINCRLLFLPDLESRLSSAKPDLSEKYSSTRTVYNR